MEPSSRSEPSGEDLKHTAKQIFQSILDAEEGNKSRTFTIIKKDVIIGTNEVIKSITNVNTTKAKTIGVILTDPLETHLQESIIDLCKIHRIPLLLVDDWFNICRPLTSIVMGFKSGVRESDNKFHSLYTLFCQAVEHAVVREKEEDKKEEVVEEKLELTTKEQDTLTFSLPTTAELFISANLRLAESASGSQEISVLDADLIVINDDDGDNDDYWPQTPFDSVTTGLDFVVRHDIVTSQEKSSGKKGKRKAIMEASGPPKKRAKKGLKRLIPAKGATKYVKGTSVTLTPGDKGKRVSKKNTSESSKKGKKNTSKPTQEGKTKKKMLKVFHLKESAIENVE